MSLSYDEKHYKEGIARKKDGNTFVYFYINTGEIVSENDKIRISKLKIPPAWSNVWISRDSESAIQAIGKDAKGRKQYRYHQVHIEKASKEKFARMYNFINKLPKLEKILIKHSELPIYEKHRIISLMLMIVKEHHLRVGKEVYARTNKSYGISSLRKKHAKVNGNQIILRFKGKSNQRLVYTIKDPYFVQSIKLLLKLDGDPLFQYIIFDDTGKEKIYKISDKDLNSYIQEYMGDEFSIKDFRTFGANLYFVKALLNETKKRTPKNRKIIKKNIVGAFKSTARQLRHTGAVSKKSYVMNFLLELYQNNPEFFISRKNEEPSAFLLDVLKLYKKNILSEE